LKAKLTPAKLQPIFNRAVVQAERYSVISGLTDSLQCSHFFAVGGSGALRFYPPNAHAMTAGEHIHFHNRDVLPYVRWMEANVSQFDWMQSSRKKTIKYTQNVLTDIKRYCTIGDMDGLTIYIEGLLK